MPLEVQATTRPPHRGNSITSAVTAGVKEPGAVQHGDAANFGWKETLSEGNFVSHIVEGHSTAPSMHRLYSKPLNSSNSPRDLLPKITHLPPLWVFITSQSDKAGIKQTYSQRCPDTQFDRCYLSYRKNTESRRPNTIFSFPHIFCNVFRSPTRQNLGCGYSSVTVTSQSIPRTQDHRTSPQVLWFPPLTAQLRPDILLNVSNTPQNFITLQKDFQKLGSRRYV